jgi:toxin ParE1/3/4
MRLSYHPEAEVELIEAAKFYQRRSKGLGEHFLREFDAAVTQIQASPERWAVVEGDLRCHTMKRFPFGIYYRVRDDKLHILVVKHHSRHPDYWRHRLSE